jgi:hypothetical protein
MNGDFVAYRNAASQGTAATKAASSSVGAPYNTFDYLQKLAADTQKQFGVLPVIRAYDNAFITPADFIALPGIGQLRLESQQPGDPGFPLFQYIFTNAAAFAPPAKDETRVLKAFEPTPVMHDTEDNAYIVRLTDMEKAHVPSTLAEVAPAVERDLRADAALKAAKAEAMTLLDAARKAGSLKAAADAAGRKVITASAVSFRGLTQPDRLYSPPPLTLPNRVVQRTFLRGAFNLFAEVTPANPKPIGTIDVPRDGRVFVSQVVEGRPTPPQTNDLASLQNVLQAEADRAGEYQQLILSRWFDYDDLTKRLDYKPAEQPAEEKSAGSAPSNGDTPPNRPLL